MKEKLCYLSWVTGCYWLIHSFGRLEEIVFCDVKIILPQRDSRVLSGGNFLGRLQEIIFCEEKTLPSLKIVR